MKTPTLILVGLTAVTTALNVAHGSPEPFRLDRISIVKFTDLGNGRVKGEIGALSIDHTVRWDGHYEIPRPNNFPDAVVGKHLIRTNDWVAYQQLAPTALDYFEVLGVANWILIGDTNHFLVSVCANATPIDGRLINISTRARLHGEDDVVIAGFVIHDRTRAVLVRAVGPTLGALGVTDAHPDPFMTVMRGQSPMYVTDNWAQSPYVSQLRQVAANVGAFPLMEESRDAAHLMMLPPGAYTVLVRSVPGAGSGTVLVEVYSISEDELPENAN